MSKLPLERLLYYNTVIAIMQEGNFCFSPLNFACGDCFLSDGVVDWESGKKYLSALPKRYAVGPLERGQLLAP